MIPWGSRDFTAESLVPVWDAEILPENLHIAATVENHKIHFADTESANLMIEINKGYQHPLAIFRAEFKNIDNPEDPEVLYFEPGNSQNSHVGVAKRTDSCAGTGSDSDTDTAG